MKVSPDQGAKMKDVLSLLFRAVLTGVVGSINAFLMSRVLVIFFPQDSQFPLKTLYLFGWSIGKMSLLTLLAGTLFSLGLTVLFIIGREIPFKPLKWLCFVLFAFGVCLESAMLYYRVSMAAGLLGALAPNCQAAVFGPWLGTLFRRPTRRPAADTRVAPSEDVLLDPPIGDLATRTIMSPDGRTTVTESGNGTRVWDANGGIPIHATDGPLERASVAGHPDVVRVLLDAPKAGGAIAHDVASGGLEDFRCSVFYAERVELRGVGKIVASIHLQEVAAVVVREASKRLDLAAGERMKAGSTQPKVRIKRHVGVDVTVDIPGLTFEVTSARVQVWEDQQFVDFRFKPAAASASSLCQGRVNFWLEGIILADVAVSILVTEESVPEIFRDQMAEVNARPYRFVFPSYSHQDADIVEQLESYAAAFGDEYLRDIRRLRAGQRWNNELRGFIKKADVFQLFWSSRAADSEYVSQEWRCGLVERESRPDPYFVRPVYWTDSPAPIPDALKSLHFAKVPLVGH